MQLPSLFGDKVSSKTLSDLVTGGQSLPPVNQDAQAPLSITPTNRDNPNDQPLSIDDSNTSPPSSPETMQDRASKFKYGLGDLLQKTQDEIYQNLQDGHEDELRASAAATVDERRRQATEDLISKTAANKGAPLSPEERDGLIEMVQSLNKETNPETILETAYGRQFIATLDRTSEKTDDNVLSDAKKVDPEGIAKVMNDHSTLVAKRMVIDTALQNAQDTLKSQGWLPWGIDLAKNIVPGYEEVQQRGNVPGVGFFSNLGLGENLEEQRKALYRLPVDDMQSTVKKTVDSLISKNPQMAVEWLTAMKGQSATDAFIQDFSLPASLIGTGIGSKSVQLAKRAIFGSLDTAAERTVRDAVRATEQMARASGMPDVSRSAIEAAAGDLEQSAITRTTTNAVADAQNVPQAQKRAVEAVSSTFRADLDDIRNNPGRFGQDIVNRIEERSNTITTQLTDVVENIQKNERLPEVLANETANRLIVEDMKGKYRDLQNSVIDTSPIYKEKTSNTYLLDFLIGKNDGTYFANRQVAENFIKYHGLGDAIIEEGKDASFTPANVAVNKATANIKSAQGIIEKEQARQKAGNLTEAQIAKSSEQISTAEEYIVDQATSRIEAQKQTAKVEQQGLGYYVRVTKPIDETRPVIRQAIAQTKNTTIPDSPIAFFMNNWIGKYTSAALAKLRTPEEVLSLAERQNRLVTTYAPSSYFKLMVDNAKEIKDLQAGRFSRGRKRWTEWQDGLQRAQELPDPIDPDRKGYFFQSPGEMEGYWQQWFHRLPDEQEIAAYFEFKRGMEIDRVFRNIAEHRNEQRVGTETHNIVTYDSAGNLQKSPDFNGVVRDKLPGAADNILVVGDKLGQEKVHALDRLDTTRKAALQKDIDRGYYKLVEIYNPELNPLSGFGNLTDERVRYVLAPQMETRALDWNHIPRRGGGHIQYDYDFYIKQANIAFDEIGNRHWYKGDTTIMAAPTQGIGQGVAKHLNEIRKFLRAKNETAAREYSNQNMHVDWDVVKNWFIGSKDLEGKYSPPRLNLNEDIQVVPRSTSIIKIDNDLRFKYAEFRDATREGSLARQAQLEFSQERDAFEMLAVNVEGTKANPLYKVSPANKVDAVTMMNRGLARISRSSFMDDYKTMAVEHWLAQAAPHIDARSLNEIYNSPYYFFNQGKFLPTATADVRLRLEASRYHTQQLTGQPSVTDALLHSAAQKLADSAFSAFGPKGLIITPTWLLPKLRDPFGFLRSIAFNVKLGLFNLPQFIVQAGNYSNIFGIAGSKYATPGTLGAQLHFWSRVNSHPNIIEALDGIASKMRIPGTSHWLPGEFKEGWEELNKTGFGRVAGEYAAIDSMSTKVIDNTFGRILDWGRAPFRAGEENARYGAWYTAFKEFRDANPVGRITDAQRADILQRADLLNVNMSRASSSAIHKGIWSIPTQFYTYQIRLTELMFGSRLTGKERARLFATNAAFYGIPMAAGTTSLPIADYLRKKALENDYVVGDNFFQDMFMNGLPAAVGAVITGLGDPSKGTWYDVGPRYGTKGLEFLGSATGTDKGWLDMLGGPVYSIAKDTITQTDGLATAMISLAKRDGESFPMTVEDMADAFKEITSFNSAYRIYAATQFGRWVSKKDAYLADSSPAQAVFGAITGLKDQNIDDITLKASSLKIQKQYEDQVENQFRQEFRRAMLAESQDPGSGKPYFTRAQRWLELGGYREDRINSLISKALSDNDSIMDKTNFDFYIRKSPDADKAGRLDAYQRTYKIQEGKQ